MTIEFIKSNSPIATISGCLQFKESNSIRRLFDLTSGYCNKCHHSVNRIGYHNCKKNRDKWAYRRRNRSYSQRPDPGLIVYIPDGKGGYEIATIYKVVPSVTIKSPAHMSDLNPIEIII